MKIIVKSLFRNNRLTKKANGNNIFKVMHSKLNKDSTIKEFVLDMQGMVVVSQVVFYELKIKMQTKFNGQFVVKLENGTPLINQAFNMVFKK